jgi:hypothetical protein
MSRRNGPSNLELAMMLGNLNPNSTTRPCTQCSKEVPKTQVLLTCDKCREKKKRQKDRRKERDMAVEEGRGAGKGFDSAPLQAVVARQEQDTAARRAARRKDGGEKADAAGASAGSTSGSLGMGMGIVMQAILDEHQRESAPKPKPAPKKKTTKNAREEEEGLDFLTSLLLFEMATKAGSTSGPAKGASSSGTKRKFKETESEANQPGTVYDAETAKKRMRGDMPMPKLEPIPQVHCFCLARELHLSRFPGWPGEQKSGRPTRSFHVETPSCEEGQKISP